MKLNSLYHESEVDVLRVYLKKLRNLCECNNINKSVLNEAKITITIDDDKQQAGLPIEVKNDFIEKAKALGEFDNPEWLTKLVRSVKQSGVQGFNEITDDEKPITNKQIQQLINLLIELINSR